MFFIWIIRIIFILTVVTVLRKFAKVMGTATLKAELYRKVRSIPILGKLIVLAWRLVKRIALALWDTVVWISKLPVFRPIAALFAALVRKGKGLWQALMAWDKAP